MLGIDPSAGRAERGLAFGYAPMAARDGLEALFALDATLGQLARGTRDPLVAEMRLTWWREALERLDDAAVPSQPVLRALADEVVPRRIAGRDLAEIVDGWEALLDDEDVVGRHARGRGGRLFAIAGRLLGAHNDPVVAAGEGWALADLALFARDPAIATAARIMAGPRLAEASRVRWSTNGRALGALTHVARMDLAGSRRGPVRRVGRLMLHRLSGR